MFVAADGEDSVADLAYLHRMWRACGDVLGMTEPVPGMNADLGPAWAQAPPGLSAARSRPGGMHQVVLRREYDTFCLSAVLEPDTVEGVTWSELDARWSRVERAAGAAPSGVLGSARLFLARLTDPATPVRACPESVQDSVPTDGSGTGVRSGPGALLGGRVAVWESCGPGDDRTVRRLAVIAGPDGDAELSALAWVVAGSVRELPPLAHYLLHAGRLRHQLRVWRAAHPGLWRLRQETDACLRELLRVVPPARHQPSERIPGTSAARLLDDLQARVLALIDRSTRLREMRRTVEIVADNLRVLDPSEEGSSAPPPASGVARPVGPFADDRALAEWFGRQLDDDAIYLEHTLQRCERIGTVLDQLSQRGRQRRQESLNAGLAGVVGAVLMCLAAVQSLEYTVPVPAAVKPAVVTALGAFALSASLAVVRVLLPDRRWSLFVLQASIGMVTASLGWVTIAAVQGSTPPPSTTLSCAGFGFLVGTAVAAALARARHRR
ncbi:hypothetical protein GT354_05590 [Streptomyces sp. SID3343]|nr:hypothetical protein [Streptomyces sp. SID3343]